MKLLTVDWNNIPEEANFCALDSDGELWAYTHEPLLKGFNGDWVCTDDGPDEECWYITNAGSGYDHTVLHKRPNKLFLDLKASLEEAVEIEKASKSEQSSEDVCKLYPKYYKDVSEITSLDVYGVHKLFSVDDPSGAIQHASKKLLLSGVRTGGKSKWDDIREARDTLNRWLELNQED
jgi:hypothetical protein